LQPTAAAAAAAAALLLLLLLLRAFKKGEGPSCSFSCAAASHPLVLLHCIFWLLQFAIEL